MLKIAAVLIFALGVAACDAVDTFPRIDESKRLGELAETVRSSVDRESKQNPDNIVLAFSLGK